MKVWEPRRLRVLKVNRKHPISNSMLATTISALLPDGEVVSESTVAGWSQEGSVGPRHRHQRVALAAALNVKLKEL